MPATLEPYLHRNAAIGARVVYDISGRRHRLARLTVGGRPVEDGTVAVIVDAHNFDGPYTYELPDGRRTRAGGRGWTMDHPLLDNPSERR